MIVPPEGGGLSQSTGKLLTNRPLGSCSADRPSRGRQGDCAWNVPVRTLASECFLWAAPSLLSAKLAPTPPPAPCQPEPSRRLGEQTASQAPPQGGGKPKPPGPTDSRAISLSQGSVQATRGHNWKAALKATRVESIATGWLVSWDLGRGGAGLQRMTSAGSSLGISLSSPPAPQRATETHPVMLGTL